MFGAILMASLKIEIASLHSSCSSFIAGVHSAVCLRVFQCSARCIRLEVPTGSRVGRPHLDSGRGSLTSSCLLRRHMDSALGAGRCACRDTISMLERNDGVCNALAKHVVDHH